MAEKPLCSVEGCDNPRRSLGLCAAHYNRRWRTGDTGGEIKPRGAPLEWIASHIAYDGDDCLIWPFGRLPNGYGRAFFRGTWRSAARVMCTLAHGEPDHPHLDTLHSCGNGHLACMNPQHVRWGTRAQNMGDAITHQTTTRGAKNAQAVLTEDDVRSIRLMASAERYADVAVRFGISPSAVGLIVRRERWGWLE